MELLAQPVSINETLIKQRNNNAQYTVKLFTLKFEPVNSNICLHVSPVKYGNYAGCVFHNFFNWMSSSSQASKTALKPLESSFKEALKIFDRKSKQYHYCHIIGRHNMSNSENFIIFLPFNCFLI